MLTTAFTVLAAAWVKSFSTAGRETTGVNAVGVAYVLLGVVVSVSDEVLSFFSCMAENNAMLMPELIPATSKKESRVFLKDVMSI